MSRTVSDFDRQLVPRRAQPGSIFDLSKPSVQTLAPGRRPPPPRRPRGISWREFGLMVVTVLSLAQGAIFAARAYTRVDPVVAKTGILVVESTPAGIGVYVNGVDSGVTPARLDLDPGAHILELRGRGVPRVIPVKMIAGATITHHVEMPSALSTGRLYVRSEPPGAPVTIDGTLRGTAPLTVPGIGVGPHRVRIGSGTSSIEQIVQVDAGATASLIVSLSLSVPFGSAVVEGPSIAVAGASSATPPSQPGQGWLAISVPFEMQVFEGDRLIGTTGDARIPLTAGAHSIDIVSTALNFRTTRTVEILTTRGRSITVELPNGSLSLNATPWAEVWIDGRQVGETPIGNLAVTIGPHEVLFKHPELGEKRNAVVVTMNGATRVSVDLTK